MLDCDWSSDVCSSDLFTEQDVTRWYGAEALGRARAWVDKVSQLEVKPPRIAARVKASWQPYNVVISLDLTKAGQPRAISGCTCGNGWMCEHAAAVLLNLLQQPRAPIPAPHPGVPPPLPPEPAAPPPRSVRPDRVVDGKPSPMLRLGTLEVLDVSRYRRYGHSERWFDYLHPLFGYGDVEVEADGDARLVTTSEGEIVEVLRDREAETAWIRQLEDLGVERIPANTVFAIHRRSPHLRGLESASHWPEFMSEHLPALRDLGWKVEVPVGFRHQVLDVESWEAEIEESEGWFHLDMGIVVEGQQIGRASCRERVS
jgi:hypothetical protein